MIEGPERLAEKLPFDRAGLNVVWTDNLAPYRTRKVRILNGAHTAAAAAAFLSGINTVREAVESPLVGRFLREVIFEEIIPATALDRVMLSGYAGEVLERFRNPAIVHRWQSILLNTTAKYQTRVLPSLLDYAAKGQGCPPRLTFALAATAVLFKDGQANGREFRGRCAQGNFLLEEDPRALAFWRDAWELYRAKGGGAAAQFILGSSDIWGQDLNPVAGLPEKLSAYLEAIVGMGVVAALEKLLAGEDL